MYLFAQQRLFVAAAQVAEPAPSGYSTAESLVRHAEARPDIAFPLLAALSPMVLIGGLLYVLVRYVLPAWREEKKADREHQTEALKGIRDDATDDGAAARELSKAQHEAVVSRVEQKVDRQTGEIVKISDRLDRHGDILQRVAASVAGKVGLFLLILWLLSGCGPSLSQQLVLRGLADAATRDCRQAPVATKASTCSGALVCAQFAADGERAIQALQVARAAGASTSGQEAAAAGTYYAAVVSCRLGGWK